MTINYFVQSEKYKPRKVEVLLVGEAPPPSQKKYFYLPAKMNVNRNIKSYTSLPATIFYHYFKSLPSSVEEYEEFLLKLQNKNIFLIDISDEPLRIRDRSSPIGIHQKNYDKLISQIPKLKEKIKNRNINISEDKIIFLLARIKYKKELQKEFPNSKFIKWIDFRTSFD